MSAQREIRRKDADLRATAANVAADAAARTKASVAQELEELQEPTNATTDLEAASLDSPAANTALEATVAEMSVNEANEALNAALAAAERASLIAARAEERTRGANVEAMRASELTRMTEARVAQAASALTAALTEGLTSVDSLSSSEDEERDVWLALEACTAHVVYEVRTLIIAVVLPLDVCKYDKAMQSLVTVLSVGRVLRQRVSK